MPSPLALLAFPLVLGAPQAAATEGDSGAAPAATSPAAPTPPAPPPPGTAPPPGYAPGYPPPGYPPPGYAPGYAPGYPPPGYAPGYPPPGYAPGYPQAGGVAPGQPTAGAPPSQAAALPEEPPPQWLLRIGLEFGSAAASEHKDLLEKEGYGLGLVWFEVTGAYLVSEHLGVGIWLATGGGSSTPTNGGPELDYESWYAGAELPISFGSRSVRMLIAPRVGYAWGRLALGGTGDTQSAPAYGMKLGVMFPKVHLGVALGWVRAPVDPPGELGRDYDLGATTFGIMGVIDG